MARGCGRQANITRGKLAGLFEQIAKVLLGAIEWQATQKECSLALADHSKAVCPC